MDHICSRALRNNPTRPSLISAQLRTKADNQRTLLRTSLEATTDLGFEALRSHIQIPNTKYKCLSLVISISKNSFSWTKRDVSGPLICKSTRISGQTDLHGSRLVRCCHLLCYVTWTTSSSTFPEAETETIPLFLEIILGNPQSGWNRFPSGWMDVV